MYTITLSEKTLKFDTIEVTTLYSIKLREKTLKCDNIDVNKKEFHQSKQPNYLNLVNVDQMVISDKFRHN